MVEYQIIHRVPACLIIDLDDTPGYFFRIFPGYAGYDIVFFYFPGDQVHILRGYETGHEDNKLIDPAFHGAPVVQAGKPIAVRNILKPAVFCLQLFFLSSCRDLCIWTVSYLIPPLYIPPYVLFPFMRDCWLLPEGLHTAVHSTLHV